MKRIRGQYLEKSWKEKLERFLLLLIQSKGTHKSRPKRIKFLLWILLQLSRIYKNIVQLRHFLYDNRILRYETLGCQVISVGNLTVGGTGKTPVVETFARELHKEGRKVAILSRGYKRKTPSIWERFRLMFTIRDYLKPMVVSDGKQIYMDSATSGDEPYMLATNLPGVCVLVGRNRVMSGRYAINTLGCDTLILDDGFQYLALRPRIQVLLVDKTNPFGNEHVLPRGILREPICNLRRANFIFITKSDGIGIQPITSKIKTFNPEAEIIECTHAPRYLVEVGSKKRRELEWLKGKRIIALSGIAVPYGFEKQLQKLGANLIGRFRFVDHHRYTLEEITYIIEESKKLNAHAIVTTEKDAVRIPLMQEISVRIYYLRVDIEITKGYADFKSCINNICHKN